MIATTEGINRILPLFRKTPRQEWGHLDHVCYPHRVCCRSPVAPLLLRQVPLRSVRCEQCRAWPCACTIQLISWPILLASFLLHFSPVLGGFLWGRKEWFVVVALYKMPVTLKWCFFLCVPKHLQTVLFGNVNKIQSLAQMCFVFPTICNFCRTTVPQHVRVKDLGHPGQASVQGDELLIP